MKKILMMLMMLLISSTVFAQQQLPPRLFFDLKILGAQNNTTLDWSASDQSPNIVVLSNPPVTSIQPTVGLFMPGVLSLSYTYQAPATASFRISSAEQFMLFGQNVDPDMNINFNFSTTIHQFQVQPQFFNQMQFKPLVIIELWRTSKTLIGQNINIEQMDNRTLIGLGGSFNLNINAYILAHVKAAYMFRDAQYGSFVDASMGLYAPALSYQVRLGYLWRRNKFQGRSQPQGVEDPFALDVKVQGFYASFSLFF